MSSSHEWGRGPDQPPSPIPERPHNVILSGVPKARHEGSGRGGSSAPAISCRLSHPGRCARPSRSRRARGPARTGAPYNSPPGRGPYRPRSHPGSVLVTIDNAPRDGLGRSVHALLAVVTAPSQTVQNPRVTPLANVARELPYTWPMPKVGCCALVLVSGMDQGSPFSGASTVLSRISPLADPRLERCFTLSRKRRQ